MADGIILATARLTGATLWTQDGDFAGMPNVRYVPKNPKLTSLASMRRCRLRNIPDPATGVRRR